jgi:cytochrome c553
MSSRNRCHAPKRSSIVAAVVGLTALAGVAHAQNVSFGQRLFQDKGDCKFCHGENGDGRGDPRSPGVASNLHNTKLNREQLIEVIACGRPATEMPHFDKYAYEEKNCYGLSAAELGQKIPPDPHSTSLNRREIEAVADYIFATFVGK